jgi:hypothetical protein
VKWYARAASMGRCARMFGLAAVFIGLSGFVRDQKVAIVES